MSAPFIHASAHVSPDAEIGAGAKILGNIEVGAYSRVGAGSVVTRDLPPRVLAVGSPARVIREL